MDTDTDTAPPVLAGNAADDDATYVDTLFADEAFPLDADELPTESEPPTLPTVPDLGASRTMTRSATYTDAPGPHYVLPSDPHRVALIVTCTGSVGYFAESGDLLNGTMGLAASLPVGVPVQLDGYTGPVYLSPNGNGLGQWAYSVIAVTR